MLNVVIGSIRWSEQPFRYRDHQQLHFPAGDRWTGAAGHVHRFSAGVH